MGAIAINLILIQFTAPKHICFTSEKKVKELNISTSKNG